jgi:hypothetical protein
MSSFSVLERYEETYTTKAKMMPKKCKCGKNSQFPANLAKFLQLIVARSSIGGANLPP